MNKREQIAEILESYYEDVFTNGDINDNACERHIDKILNLFPQVRVTPEMVEDGRVKWLSSQERLDCLRTGNGGLDAYIASYINSLTAPQQGCEGCMEIKNLFARDDIVKHRNGSAYKILGRCFIEATMVDCYAYRGEDGRMWVRPASEMEDGRFTLVGHPPSKQEKECHGTGKVEGKE